MKSFKKKLRLLGFIFLIVLATLGIGINGGVPIPPSKKEEKIEIKVELLESDEEQNLVILDIKQ